MTRSKAQTLLAAGYVLAVIGLIAGATSDVFHPDPVVAFFLTSARPFLDFLICR